MSSKQSGVGSTKSGRTLGERIFLRFPALADLAAAALLRLPPGSLLRRTLVKQAFRIAWTGINRNDYEPALLAYESDAEVVLFGAEGVGLAESYAGNSGWVDFMVDIHENFGSRHFAVVRVRDGGSRLVAEIALTATGKTSGARVEETTTSVYRFSSRGKVARQEIFWHQDSWGTALAAAGLGE